MAPGDAVFFDPYTFRKYVEIIGRAYRERATTLIEICRLYAETSPQTYTMSDGLQSVLRLADAAVSAAVRAGKGTTAEATDAFVRVQDEIARSSLPTPQKGTPGSHREKIFEMSTALEVASLKDERSMSTLSRVTSALNAPTPSGVTKKVNFVILESPPYQQRNDELIIHQEIDNSTTIAKIVWTFSRFPETSIHRITPRIASKQNPHFYVRLSENAASYGIGFHKDPLKGLSRDISTGDTIFVLLDKSCRLFLDAAKPHMPRIFGNLWKPHDTVILKDVCGVLDSEDTILRNIGKSQDYWYRPSITEPSQRRAQSGYSGADNDIVNTPFASARAVIDAALRAQGIDLMIRDRSRPLPPADSGWKLLPSTVPIVRVLELEDQTIHRPPATRLPQPEFSHPHSNSPNIGSSIQLTASIESFDVIANTPEGSSPLRAEAGEFPQSTGDLQVEPPTGTPSTPPPLAPPVKRMAPSLFAQEQELMFWTPVRGKNRGKSWTQTYHEYNYDP